MAYNRKLAEALQAPALVVMALILFTATAEAQILQPLLGGILPPVGSLLNLTGLNAIGRVCCTPNGNCLLGSSGVPGVAVGLYCDDGTALGVQVGQGLTNVSGIFNISVPNVVQTLGNVLTLNPVVPCNFVIQLPLNQTLCSVLNTTQGVLTGVPSVVAGLVQGVSGLLACLLVTGLTLSVQV